ncbi:hypothetical protein GCM10025868_03300 [Angustibacter aerolatus]|uniref:TIGR03085 family protein n=1 Tax=Angustibacter aerolatus TaxID=1162965 RepID=A0ABQ6JA60_9ACTN|nr:TIGR03085 family metal-binding protein [Angustibacter aerolatus]GMA85080.1 hypothetical protein GCM10025868_03300 [Angustibacter aerolatus]
MSRYAQSERQALSDTLLAVGPDQPTECEGWLTRDLATHLVVRDRRPDLQAAMLVPPLRERAERGQEALAGRPWTDLVEDVRSGPPAWSPLRLGPLDEAINTAEFFVHHEDVRRAQPDWAPRELDPDLERALWSATKVVGRLALRTAPVGVEPRRTRPAPHRRPPRAPGGAGGGRGGRGRAVRLRPPPGRAGRARRRRRGGRAAARTRPAAGSHPTGWRLPDLAAT